jgi:hypothetical protein
MQISNVSPHMAPLDPPPSGFIELCLPSPAEHPPSGPDWTHEIKHDGYRLRARRDPISIRLLTRNGHDWAARYSLIAEAIDRLKVRSCLIDGEAVACDENGLAVFERLRRKPSGKHVFLYAFRPPRAGPAALLLLRPPLHTTPSADLSCALPLQPQESRPCSPRPT